MFLLEKVALCLTDKGYADNVLVFAGPNIQPCQVLDVTIGQYLLVGQALRQIALPGQRFIVTLISLATLLELFPLLPLAHRSLLLGTSMVQSNS